MNAYVKDSRLESFDYGDLYKSATIFLQLDDIAFISVLNDAKSTMAIMKKHLDNITGKLTPIQVRELHALFAYNNMRITNRSSYSSQVSESGELTLKADTPTNKKISAFNRKEMGGYVHFNLLSFLDEFEPDKRSEIENGIKNGMYTFLFKKDGSFNDASIIFK